MLVNILYILCCVFWTMYILKSIYHRDGKITIKTLLWSIFNGIMCPFSIAINIVYISNTHKKRYSVFINKEWLRKVDPRFHESYKKYILKGEIDYEFFSYLRTSRHCKEAVGMAFDEMFYDQNEVSIIIKKRL